MNINKGQFYNPNMPKAPDHTKFKIQLRTDTLPDGSTSDEQDQRERPR